ncbi:recombinase family protein [Streptomyces sp. RLB1-33]
MSTGGQKPDRQIDALTAAGCRRIFADKESGKDDLRPELKACHAFLTAGDTLAVPALDRYGRSLKDLVNMVGELRRREIGFSSLHERLDTITPGGRPTVATPEIIRAARDMLPDLENSITSIAKLLGLSPGTLYNHVPDLQELRASGRVPKQLTTG